MTASKLLDVLFKKICAQAGGLIAERSLSRIGFAPMGDDAENLAFVWLSAGHGEEGRLGGAGGILPVEENTIAGHGGAQSGRFGPCLPMLGQEAVNVRGIRRRVLFAEGDLRFNRGTGRQGSGEAT
jgi:hypothetical protein